MFIFILSFMNIMDRIKKKYIVDEALNKIAVQIDLKDYERLEQLIEDYSLGKYIEENNPEEVLSLNEAKEFYKKMKTEAKIGSKGK